MKNGKAKRPRDANQLAKLVTDIATGEVDDCLTPEEERARKAGKAGGKKRAEKLTPERRKEIAKRAAEARWKRDG